MMVMASMAAGQPADPGPTGAAAVFTSAHPIMARIRELMVDGRLTEAETLLRTSKEASDPSAAGLVNEASEVIRRLRREYDVDPAELVRRLRQSIPDAAEADVEGWREAGWVQWRMIDGQVRYFRREPANIFRFCDDAKRRRDKRAARRPEAADSDPTSQPSPEQRLLTHLARVIAAAETSGQAQVLPMRHRVRYRLTVPANRPDAKVGSLVRCWLPFPQEYLQQRDVRLIRTSPAAHVVAPNVIDGKTLGGAPQRTVYLEQRIRDPAEPIVFEEEFEYVSSAYYPDLKDSQARALPAHYHGAYLGQRPPHIVFSSELERLVRQVVGQETNPLARARRVFHFVADKIRYCSEEEYSVIPSFTAKALSTRKGDCGIQSMLFITMCRAAGIPARWQSGFETKPGEWNMHDWAEFYVEPWGWLPADVSYGLKSSDDARVREFYFGHQDAYRLIVNLDYGSPLQPPKESLRSEPADFQRGEVEVDGRNLYLDEWEWDFQFDVEPLDE